MAGIEETRAQIIQIVAKTLKKSPESIQDSSTLQDLGADSLDLVEIIMNLEEHFGIHIEDEQAEKLKTVSDVVQYIHGLLEKK